jgi:hypothetical protein
VPYLAKVVLHCRSGVPQGLSQLVEAFISDGVRYIGVVGSDAALIEDMIDEYVVGDGTDSSRYILTASHPGGTVDTAMELAKKLSGDLCGEVQLVEF